MKRSMILAGCCLLLCGIVLCSALTARQQALADKLIRFHVVANSDSADDQALKLKVRDALLEKLKPLSAQAKNREDMAALLQRSLPMLQDEAEQTLRRGGCGDPVTVTLETEPFPTRYYDTFTLPAGDYLSLRVRLGAAKGHNWWCVCFPGLCESACTRDLTAVAAGAGFTKDEIEWITRCDRYEIRFKVLEWLEALRKK